MSIGVNATIGAQIKHIYSSASKILTMINHYQCQHGFMISSHFSSIVEQHIEIMIQKKTFADILIALTLEFLEKDRSFSHHFKLKII